MPMSEAVTVRAKFDDDDFNSFGGIACDGHTHTHTRRHGLGSTVKFSKSLTSCKQKHMANTFKPL